jgi:hypothetical protein
MRIKPSSTAIAAVLLALNLGATAHAGAMSSQVVAQSSDSSGVLWQRSHSGEKAAGLASTPWANWLDQSYRYAGQASAEFQTLRSKMQASGSTSYFTQGFSTLSSFSTQTVVPGTGGSSTQLNLALRLDGSSYADASVSSIGLDLNSARSLDLSAGSTLRYRVVDLDWIDTELLTPITLLELSIGSGVSWQGGVTHYQDGSWASYTTVRTGTAGYCSVGCNGNYGIELFNQVDQQDYNYLHAGTSFSSDTGPLSFDIDAIAGHRLLIEASLDASIYYWGCDICDFYAGSDFSRTFDAELSADGVPLEGLLAGVAPALEPGPNGVPEPASWTLALPAALLALRRRRTATAR